VRPRGVRTLALSALCAATAVAACSAEDGRARLDWERMQEQPRYETYGESRFFPDGSAMRRPPDGTVPHDAVVDRPLLTTGFAGGRPAERIPVPVTPELLALGRRRFDTYCAVCHGVLGNGQSAVASRFRLRRPPPLIGDRVRALPPGRVYRVVTEGYGLMPAYAADLPVTERWAVVAYLRALQLSRYAPVDSLPPEVLAELRRAVGGAQ
jgi:mono/diheme cytochrome c family protein